MIIDGTLPFTMSHSKRETPPGNNLGMEQSLKINVFSEVYMYMYSTLASSSRGMATSFGRQTAQNLLLYLPPSPCMYEF